MKKFRIRYFVQIFFFALVFMIVLNHTLAESGRSIGFLPEVSLHAICPFGGVETFFSVVLFNTMIWKVQQSSLILMYIILFMSLLLGPVLCGWICPLGSVQEWVGKIGKKIFKRKYNTFVPRKADKYLRYLRFLSLIAVIYLSTKSLRLVFLEVDPYYALMHFYSNEVAIGAYIVLAATLIGSLFVERPWCKYLCPYGALLGLFNKIRIFKIRVGRENCINCGKCTKVCPMNIDVENMEKVTDLQCISCLECTSEYACPVKDNVKLKLKGEISHEA